MPRSIPTQRVPPHIRIAFQYGAALLVGSGLVLGDIPAWREFGDLILAITLVMAALRGRERQRAKRTAEQIQAEANRRTQRRSQRRQRDEQRRTVRQTRRDAIARDTARQSERRAAEQAVRRAASEQEVRQRAAQEIAREALQQRIAALAAPDLYAETMRLFEQRGFVAEPIGPEEGFDLRLRRVDDGALHVARLLPRNHRASLTDIRMLDAWRARERADHAYLIAMAGFAPEAVREVARLPITLVETHLLASWSETASASTS